jgi:hypothetical protein
MLVRTLTTTATAGAALVLLALPAAASPECDAAGATLVHEAHELAGPAGGPLHAFEDAYCDAGLLP